MPSIQQKGENKWLLVVSAGYDINGKRQRVTKMFEGTRRQAEKAAILFEQEVKQGKYVHEAKNYTLAAFVYNVWLPDYAQQQLAPKTLHRYKEMLDNRILPALGNIKLEQLRPVHINRFINDLAVAPRLDGRPGQLSPMTVRHHYRCLSAILQDAYKWGLIPENPCNRTEPPKVPRTRIRTLTEEETQQMLLSLQEQSLKGRTLIWLAIASGLREGEIMGLEWDDIDFADSTISVKRVSQYLPGRGVYTKAPKNESSQRTIAIPENVMALLREYRIEWLENKLKAGSLWQGTNRIFCTWDGRPGTPDWPLKWWHRFLMRAGLPKVSFHSLRHLSATMLIAANVPLKNVSERLGHTNINTTTNIYAEALKSVDRQAAEKIGELLEPKNRRKNRRS